MFQFDFIQCIRMADQKQRKEIQTITSLSRTTTPKKKLGSTHTPQKKKRKKINPEGVPRASEITLSTRFKKLNYLRSTEITQ